MAKKEYFVFEGRNASTGDPNRTTGRVSFYGNYIGFNSKAEAKKYVEKYSTGYASDICVAGTRRTLRKYDLGSRVDQYNEHLDRVMTETYYEE